jgi:hypothetical protein
MPRPLKIFTVEGRVAHLPSHVINDVLGAPRHINQGHVYVVARTKKDATHYLSTALKTHWKVSEIHEASGNHLEAFINGARFLGTDHDSYESKVAVSWGRGGERFAVPIEDTWTLVGETTHRDPANPRNLLKRPFFVPATPAPKPVRLVIELDADTDPAVIERFRAGLSVLVNTQDVRALGMVVES